MHRKQAITIVVIVSSDRFMYRILLKGQAVLLTSGLVLWRSLFTGLCPYVGRGELTRALAGPAEPKVLRWLKAGGGKGRKTALQTLALNSGASPGYGNSGKLFNSLCLNLRNDTDVSTSSREAGMDWVRWDMQDDWDGTWSQGVLRRC